VSTYLYLVCLDHTPPLKAAAESGQHMYDLPQIQADIAARERFVTNTQDDIWPDSHFRRNTAAFLAKHPRCRIGIEDEYGDTHPTEESR